MNLFNCFDNFITARNQGIDGNGFISLNGNKRFFGCQFTVCIQIHSGIIEGLNIEFKFHISYRTRNITRICTEVFLYFQFGFINILII